VSSYLTFRILKGLFVVVLISVLTFVVMRMMPGDPVYLLLGEGQIPITDAQIQAIREKWGLDRPLHEQYFVWALNLLRGDFGESLIRAGVPVRDMIFEAIPVTALLNVYALAGDRGRHPVRHRRRGAPQQLGRLRVERHLGARHRHAELLAGADADRAVRALRAALVRRPAAHRSDTAVRLRSWQGWILPVIVIATEEMAVLMRITRGAVLELLPQDFVRTARSKGWPSAPCCTATSSPTRCCP
jgi:peptide/nickel transport system permease protein